MKKIFFVKTLILCCQFGIEHVKMYLNYLLKMNVNIYEHWDIFYVRICGGWDLNG